jgi:hypothetical protein
VRSRTDVAFGKSHRDGIGEIDIITRRSPLYRTFYHLTFLNHPRLLSESLRRADSNKETSRCDRGADRSKTTPDKVQKPPFGLDYQFSIFAHCNSSSNILIVAPRVKNRAQCRINDAGIPWKIINVG